METPTTRHTELVARSEHSLGWRAQTLQILCRCFCVGVSLFLCRFFVSVFFVSVFFVCVGLSVSVSACSVCCFFLVCLLLVLCVGFLCACRFFVSAFCLRVVFVCVLAFVCVVFCRLFLCKVVRVSRSLEWRVSEWCRFRMYGSGTCLLRLGLRAIHDHGIFHVHSVFCSDHSLKFAHQNSHPPSSTCLTRVLAMSLPMQNWIAS